MNWKVVIAGVHSLDSVKDVASRFVEFLKEEGIAVHAADVVCEKVEESLNLLHEHTPEIVAGIREKLEAALAPEVTPPAVTAPTPAPVETPAPAPEPAPEAPVAPAAPEAA